VLNIIYFRSGNSTVFKWNKNCNRLINSQPNNCTLPVSVSKNQLDNLKKYPSVKMKFVFWKGIIEHDPPIRSVTDGSINLNDQQKKRVQFIHQIKRRYNICNNVWLEVFNDWSRVQFGFASLFGENVVIFLFLLSAGGLKHS
jgi:hypothetical protein